MHSGRSRDNLDLSGEWESVRGYAFRWGFRKKRNPGAEFMKRLIVAVAVLSFAMSSESAQTLEDLKNDGKNTDTISFLEPIEWNVRLQLRGFSHLCARLHRHGNPSLRTDHHS